MLQFLHSLRHSQLARTITTGVTLSSVFLIESTALAQVGSADEEPQNRWVLAYALVFLFFGLSLYSITRGSNRRRN